jgi:hypothetical protein
MPFVHTVQKGAKICEPCQDIGNKRLEVVVDIKTCWMLMLNPLKQLLGECKSLMKMHIDAPKSKFV